jgi:hypothetical protein
MSSAVFETIRLLEAANLHFFIERTRSDSIQLTVTLVGERLEIDIFEDDHLEIARFRGDESVEGGKELLLNILASVAKDEKRYEKKLEQLGIHPERSRSAAEAEAKQRALAAGAEPASLKTVDVEDMPLAYLPGNALRVCVVGAMAAGTQYGSSSVSQ